MYPINTSMVLLKKNDDDILKKVENNIQCKDK